jgi:tetratricopeptide (TPR) repeat protein
LITADGVLKVTDFGLAKLFDNETLDGMKSVIPQGMKSHLTATTVGTCTHMAPEQFDNAAGVGLKADIYSFGVMLYQMVSGELPFQGESWKDLERLHKTQEPPLLKTTDSKLAELIQKCMTKDPAGRFSDFSEIRELLSNIYKRLAGTPPAAPAEGAALSAVHWNNKGCSLENLGLHREALECYDSALKLDPSLASAWFNQGVALFASGQGDAALASYDRALELNPKSEQAWSNKGVALKQQGKTVKAIACYDQALQINRRYPNAWINKGVALRMLGKTDEALDCYTRALALNPKDETGWTNKGNILYGRNQAAEALACYERALDVNPSLDRTWLNKGMALNAQGKNADALKCFEKAIQLNPRLEQAWYLRGMTLMTVFQRVQDAVPCFMEAKRLGSKEATQALEMCKEVLKQA